MLIHEVQKLKSKIAIWNKASWFKRYLR
jgi:hypothetical protein